MQTVADPQGHFAFHVFHCGTGRAVSDDGRPELNIGAFGLVSALSFNLISARPSFWEKS